MESGNRKYKNDDITVYWKPSSCIHASTCVNELPLVFRSEERPWVRMDGASTNDIIEVVDKCPVDALMWSWNDEKKNKNVGVEHPNHLNNRRKLPTGNASAGTTDQVAAVKFSEAGPMMVTGSFFIERENGTRSKFNGTVSICTCGNTRLSPFCDGSHRNLNK